MIAFTVAGVPAPQGSKTRTRWGGMREDNEATRPWRNAVAWNAGQAMVVRDEMGEASRRPPLTGPLALTAAFYFPRPKSHFRTGKHAGELKANAPEWCATKPDTDKLLRAVGDAITGVIVQDDAQLVHLTATKRYGTPRAEIAVKEAL